jgi:hypothetical protein
MKYLTEYILCQVYKFKSNIIVIYQEAIPAYTLMNLKYAMFPKSVVSREPWFI